MMSSPLLLFSAEAAPPLIFIPTDGASPDEAQQQASWLMSILQKRAGSEWRSEWLSDGVQIMPWAIFRRWLKRSPEEARDEATGILEQLERAGVRSQEELDWLAQADPTLRERLAKAAEEQDAKAEKDPSRLK
jgi:hypothetical protein